MSYHMISFVFMYSHLYVIIVFFVYFIFSIKHEYRFIPLLITAQKHFQYTGTTVELIYTSHLL